jgi:mannose-6-phosphate isomerase
MVAALDHLRLQRNSCGLKRFFNELISMDSEQQKRAVDEARENAQRFVDEDVGFYWMLRLASEYPKDIAILSPLILNLAQLKPAQALFLPTGELHAYLEGFGIELMANSDNVLRGGLTAKHTDIPELLKVITFEPRNIDILKTIQKDPTEQVYDCQADEFALSVISVSGSRSYQSATSRSVEIILCTDGSTSLVDHGTQDCIKLAKGTSIIIPAAVQSYSISGHGTLFKASVPV